MTTKNTRKPATKSKRKSRSLALETCSDSVIVRRAGMQIVDGLAWLQAGHILIDGTDAPQWMHDINGCDVECAANVIRQNSKDQPRAEKE